MFQQKVLKAALMLRRLGNTYQTKEEQIAEFLEWYAERETALDEWIDSMREELAKTPEQLEAERQEFLEELLEREAEASAREIASLRRERDEWDDFWDDRARSVGAY